MSQSDRIKNRRKDMNEARLQLIEAARVVCGDFRLREDFSAGGVGAAIRTAKSLYEDPIGPANGPLRS